MPNKAISIQSAPQRHPCLRSSSPDPERISFLFWGDSYPCQYVYPGYCECWVLSRRFGDPMLTKPPPRILRLPGRVRKVWGLCVNSPPAWLPNRNKPFPTVTTFLPSLSARLLSPRMPLRFTVKWPYSPVTGSIRTSGSSLPVFFCSAFM